MFKMYDIVYSVTFHEEIDCVVDFITNLNYFNKGLSVLIICNVNNSLDLSKLTIFKNVVVNSRMCDKKLYSIDLFNAHVDNYDYLQLFGIDYTLFILLASNSLFIKHFTKEMFISINTCVQNLVKPIHDGFEKTEPFTGWWHPKIQQDTSVIAFLKALNLPKNAPTSQHEGMVMSKYAISQVSLLSTQHKLYDTNKLGNYPSEEILFRYILYYIGHPNILITKVFWNKYKYSINAEELLLLIHDNEKTDNNIKCNINEISIKRIDRKFNDVNRKIIRELNNNYKTE